MRSPVTALIQQYNSLTDVEQKVFLDLVDPQPEPQEVKRTRKKRATSAASAAAKKRGLPDTATAAGADAETATTHALCVANVPTLNVPCASSELNAIHDPKGGYAGYHPFEAPKVVARAQRKLRQKKEEPGSIPNSEIETATAIGAGAGAGD